MISIESLKEMHPEDRLFFSKIVAVAVVLLLGTAWLLSIFFLQGSVFSLKTKSLQSAASINAFDPIFNKTSELVNSKNTQSHNQTQKQPVGVPRQITQEDIDRAAKNFIKLQTGRGGEVEPAKEYTAETSPGIKNFPY